MSFFSNRFTNQHKSLLLYTTILLAWGIGFGCYFYFTCQPVLKDLLSQLFFSNQENYTNNFHFYVISTAIFIITSIVCSTSFLGTILCSFILFTKGIHISFSILALFEVGAITLQSFFTILIPQLIIELIMIYIISITSLKLAINTFIISFVYKENFKTSKIIHYILDYLIIILTIVTISMLFRVYLI